MKRILKIFVGIAVVLSLCLSALTIGVFATGSASITFSKQNISVGDTVNITITVSANEMYDANLSGSYNEEVLSYVSGAESGGAGVFTIFPNEGLGGANSKTFTLTFKAAKAGSSAVSVKGQVSSGIPPVDVDVAASAALNVKDVTLSNNANLKYLRPSVGSLSPRFSQNVTEYTVNVKKNVTECKVYADTVEPDAKVAVTGSATLKIGENKRVVTVTAPSGAQKSYTITIIRSDVDEPTESEVTSSTVEVPSDLEVIIDGVSYIVLSDISAVNLPTGFNVTKRLYNNQEVSVAVDENKNYELFYLKDSSGETAVPYTYDAEKNMFTRVSVINQLNVSYIVAEIPDNLTVPTGYEKKSFKVGEMTLSGYASADTVFEDMYYIYCYNGSKYATYRYDSVENVLQRSPEFVLSDAVVEEVGGKIEILNRFAKLTANAKTIVVCLCVLFLGAIALLKLDIIKLVKRGKLDDFDEDDVDDFDNVSFDEENEE